MDKAREELAIGDIGYRSHTWVKESLNCGLTPAKCSQCGVSSGLSRASSSLCLGKDEYGNKN